MSERLSTYLIGKFMSDFENLGKEAGCDFFVREIVETIKRRNGGGDGHEGSRRPPGGW